MMAERSVADMQGQLKQATTEAERIGAAAAAGKMSRDEAKRQLREIDRTIKDVQEELMQRIGAKPRKRRPR